MAGNGWNSSNAYTQGLNANWKNEPYTDGPIACRICGHILMNNSTLFDHIEDHLLVDEEGARRKVLLSHMYPSQRDLFDTLCNQTNAGGNLADLPSATAATSPRNYLAPPIRKEHGVIQIVYVERPPQCFARPFLTQLEASLLMDGVATSTERNLAVKHEDQPMVDLTLKL